MKSGIRPIEDELVKTIRWQSNLQSEKEVEESISSLSQVPEQHGLAERQKEGWEGLYIYWWGGGILSVEGRWEEFYKLVGGGV